MSYEQLVYIAGLHVATIWRENGISPLENKLCWTDNLSWKIVCEQTSYKLREISTDRQSVEISIEEATDRQYVEISTELVCLTSRRGRFRRTDNPLKSVSKGNTLIQNYWTPTWLCRRSPGQFVQISRLLVGC